MIQATLLIGSNDINEFMRMFDLSPPGNSFVTEHLAATVVDDFGESNVATIVEVLDKTPFSFIGIAAANGYRWAGATTISDGQKRWELAPYLEILVSQLKGKT